MKGKHTLITVATVMVLLMTGMIISSCTKEGPEGKPGLDGIDGKDGAESCSSCHNFSEILLAKISQYQNSVHAKGATLDHNNQGCGHCHTSMGFRNFLSDGTIATVNNPTPINCRTCHPIHESYTLNDYGLRTSAPVNLLLGEGQYDYGNSNLCANCHQAHDLNPYPVAGGDSLTIASKYYGPHHAPHVNMLIGKGAYPIPGSMAYLNSPHTRAVKGGCVTCHMSDATGNWAGGHQMNIKYKNSSGTTVYQYTGCLSSGCHETTAEVTAKINPNRAEIQGLLSELKTKLLEKDLMDADGYIRPNKKMSQMDLACFINYKFVSEDNSYGAHNYRFTKALLVNTLEYINPPR